MLANLKQFVDRIFVKSGKHFILTNNGFLIMGSFIFNTEWYFIVILYILIIFYYFESDFLLRCCTSHEDTMEEFSPAFALRASIHSVCKLL